MQILNINLELLMSMPGGTEWVLIIIAILLLFGGKKIPELARGIGKGIRDFKEAKDEGQKTTSNIDNVKV